MSIVDTTNSVGPTLGDLGEEPSDDAVGDYEVIDYPDPITHGFGLEAVINDLDHPQGSAYRRLFEVWQEYVGDREHEPYIVLEDVHDEWEFLHDDYPAHLVLTSKGWKAGRDADEDGLVGQFYEYSLQVMRYEEDSGKLDAELDESLRAPVSFQCYVQPQDESLVLPSGDNLICAFGEGTKFRVQTTYADAADALGRMVRVVTDAFDAFCRDRPAWETMARESWRVWKGEVHHRIDESLMAAAAQKIRSARTLVEYGGDGDASGGGEFTQGKHVEEKAVSDMWDRIGFAGYANRAGFNLGLKVYRISSSAADERLQHPKLEAFFAGTDRSTRLPHLDEWVVLRATLRQMASAFAIRCGVALADLREDDYYHPMDRERVDIMVPQGWRRAMREANEERERRILKTTYESLSMASWDVLWTIQATAGCTYETLSEVTGYGYDYVREVVANLEQQDILRRQTYPRVIVYHNEELRLNAREKLQEVHPDRGLDTIREDAEDRRERRQENQQARAEADDSSDDDDVQDGATEDVDAASGSSSEWRLFDDVRLNAEQLRRALVENYIEHEHVSIRVDPYPELFGPPPDG